MLLKNLSSHVQGIWNAKKLENLRVEMLHLFQVTDLFFFTFSGTIAGKQFEQTLHTVSVDTQ